MPLALALALALTLALLTLALTLALLTLPDVGVELERGVHVERHALWLAALAWLGLGLK